MTEIFEGVVRFFGGDKRYFRSTLEKLEDGSLSKSSDAQKTRAFNKVHNIEDFGEEIPQEVSSLPQIKSWIEQIIQFSKENPTHKITKNYANYAIKNLEYYSEVNFSKLKTEILSSEFVEGNNRYRVFFNEEIKVGDYGKLGYPMLDECRASLKEFNKSSKYNTNQTQNYKGDIFNILNDQINMFDVKEYFRIDSRLKFPYFLDLEVNKYHKTVDSNLGRDLHIFSFLKENNGLYLESSVEDFITKVSQGERPVEDEVSIDFSLFYKLFAFMEFGFVALYKEDIVKTFIFKDGDSLVFKKLDLNNKIDEESKIKMKYHKDLNTGYTYVVFEYGGEVFYIISQRSNFSKGNCAFVNNAFFKEVKKVPLEMKTYKKYAKNFSSGSGKAMEMYVWNEIFTNNEQVRDVISKIRN